MDSAEALRPAVSDIAKEAVPRCPACESSERHHLYDVVEHEYDTTTTDVFPLMACDACGAQYLSPRPAVSALDVIYPPNYFLHVLESRAGDDVDVARRSAFAFFQDKLFKLRIRPIERQLSLGPDRTWLDIGCGTGAVLQSMFQAYGMRGTGLDFSEQAVRVCRKRGFEAYQSRFEDFEPASGEQYDLLHSSHVIEHVESPLDYMKKSFALLKPGGLKVFITPNTAAWEARRLREHWGGLHVPRHWTMLDPRSARSLGERVGFEYVETSFSTNGVFLGWSLHSWLQERYGRRIADRVFPSDHKLIESNFGNLARNGLLTMLDLVKLVVTRQSANMLVMFRKPLA